MSPMPPRMITAMPLCSIGWPISGNTALEYSAINTPPMPPSAAATNEVSRNRPSTLMPSSAAAFGDSAMARSARPSWVRRITSSSPAISANDSTMMAISSMLICTGPRCSWRSGTTSDGKRRFSAPNRPCAALLKKMATPIVAIIGIRCGALRARKGLSTSTSISSPTRPLSRNATTSAAQSGNPSRTTASSAA